MKNKLSFLAAIVVSVTSLWANPSEINYQGVLTDQQGNPINGVRAMQIKIYDAPTGGTLLYSEDLGNVPVQDGIYSFSFGANGTSNALTTETVAIANGTVSTFQKVLAAPTVVAGSVTVTDGIYTWDQTNGSSNENDFGVGYSPNLRRVTATYYNGAPASGKTIFAKFRTPNIGISGVFNDGTAWAEIIIGGSAQVARQKILTVPISLVARKALQLEAKNKTEMLPFDGVTANDVTYNQGGASASQVIILPKNILQVNKIMFNIELQLASIGDTRDYARIAFSITEFDPKANTSKNVFSYEESAPYPSGQISKIVSTGPLTFDQENKYYKINVSASSLAYDYWSYGRDYIGIAKSLIKWIQIDYNE
jgi:hypothetical protein